VRERELRKYWYKTVIYIFLSSRSCYQANKPLEVATLHFKISFFLTKIILDFFSIIFCYHHD